MASIPHRYPMLLVDRITELEPGKRAVGLKNVSINESFFQGHYPGFPIMPGVLILEAIAQAGAVTLLTGHLSNGTVPVIGAIDNVRFRRQVVPGDQLRLEVEILKLKGSVGRLKGNASVDGQVAAEMEMTFMLVKKED